MVEKRSKRKMEYRSLRQVRLASSIPSYPVVCLGMTFCWISSLSEYLNLVTRCLLLRVYALTIERANVLKGHKPYFDLAEDRTAKSLKFNNKSNVPQSSRPQLTWFVKDTMQSF